MRVKRLIKFAEVGHHCVEVGFLAKVHFPHFLAAPAEGRFELGTGRKAEGPLSRGFISRPALPGEVSLVFCDLVQQIEILQRPKSPGMFGDDHNVVIMAKDPFSNGPTRSGPIVLAM